MGKIAIEVAKKNGAYELDTMLVKVSLSVFRQ